MPRPGPKEPPAPPTIEPQHTVDRSAVLQPAASARSSASSLLHEVGRHVGGEPGACWCCRLGDSHFDRLVKGAVFEHQRLLSQLSDLHQNGALAASPHDSPASTGACRYSRTANGACDVQAPEWTPDGTASSQSLVEGDTPPAMETAARMSLQQRCSLTKTIVMDEKYFEECKKLQLQKSGGSPERRTSWVKARLAFMVHHRAFELVFAFFILLNSIMLGISLQLSATSATDYNIEKDFAVPQQLFNVLFVLEWILRVTVAGRSFFIPGPDFHWNCLDTLNFLLIVVSEWALAIFAASVDSAFFSGVRAVKVLRMIRMLRVLRVSKLLSVIRALRYLVCSIGNTLEPLSWAVALLVLVCFIFGTMLTQAARNYRDTDGTSVDRQVLEDFEYWWGDLVSSMYTLFMSISGGVSWIEPATPLWEMPMFLCLFLIYIIFTYFAVLNVVTGVFCERAIQSAHDDHYNLIQGLRDKRQELNATMKRVFQRIDTTGSGFVTLDEFEQIVEDEEIKLLFESMEISVVDARALFKHLDADEGGQLELHELISGAMRIRGAAKGLDMVRLQHDMTKVKEQVRAIARSIDELFFREATEGTVGHTRGMMEGKP